MRVLSLHADPGTSLPKARVDWVRLVEGMGVEGDRHYGKNPDRAVLVAGQAAYDHAAQAGLILPPGALGENLRVDFDPHALGAGARLQVGPAVLELTAVCTVCSSLSTFDLRLPKLLLGRRGMYARVLRGGVVRVGDPVHLLTPQAMG
ncbi:MOSC domain-containing protein [Meiothermus sp. QL-1]|uniref:MOSC domain-containing protein n=1 Tax=Meiothermus sp. QL-1 TaxID=2058095 RepID=UPI000E0C9E0D|nr:MOSC domain-containing protein [Meiothermus sp. QL-1]RDI96438.1 MOSC domain-containing protein [Meiothermus sp. QL-1]